MFNMMYAMGGGVTYQDILRMRRRRFMFFLSRLAEQKKKENQAIKTAREGGGSAPKAKTGNQKLLGK